MCMTHRSTDSCDSRDCHPIAEVVVILDTNGRIILERSLLEDALDCLVGVHVETLVFWLVELTDLHDCE